MKKSLELLCVCGIALLLPLNSHADEEFYGKIDSRPAIKAGTWVVGGRSFEVTEKTELEEDHGPLVVGACAEVEYKGAMVEEIESKKENKCKK
ncbi:MAG TPA: DUF5666 domain-containing protein [Methylophilaceae bacterium]|nr:DUF5666 domain-containing protein [Methylophilaceae bacterium]